ncbi:MAG: phage terminase large subunit [Boseongicola sp. SB0675_bin_26]|nr:phage terminase large subunit [Boseongicola sp. SB0665_bin_10]MYH57611.1 phage terminase large subunit [Boseongicola sp. SB0675_bin_26]
MPGSDDRNAKARLAELMHEKLRRNADKSLLAYAQYMVPSFKVNHHHERIAEVLEDCEAGLIDRALITTPPRHGKSLLCSVVFPAWYLGRHPTNEVIATAYGSELVSGFGRRLRNLVRDPRHADIFGEDAALSPESRARDMWLTMGGGVYRAAGVGGGITGFGGHCLIIDDPVKSWKEADSPVVQSQTWDWYQSDFHTRVMKGGFILVIQTRWNENDLAGKLLAEEEKGGEQWHKVHFPAVDRDGKALWPEMYDIDYFSRRMRNNRVWQALYQGNPLPAEGNLFTENMFRTYDRMPDIGRMRIYGASDYAVSFGKGDFTVHAVVGVDENDDIYLLDLWRRQESSDVSVDAQLALMLRWKPLIWAEESGQIVKSIGPFLEKRQRELKAWGARRQFSSTTDKAARAQSFLARMGSGKVVFPAHAPWYPELKAEMLKFPLGKHDDQVDALSLIGRLIDRMSTGKAKEGPGEKPPALTIGGNLPPGMRGFTWGEVVKDVIDLSRRRRRHAA